MKGLRLHLPQAQHDGLHPLSSPLPLPHPCRQGQPSPGLFLVLVGECELRRRPLPSSRGRDRGVTDFVDTLMTVGGGKGWTSGTSTGSDDGDSLGGDGDSSSSSRSSAAAAVRSSRSSAAGAAVRSSRISAAAVVSRSSSLLPMLGDLDHSREVRRRATNEWFKSKCGGF